MTKNRILYLCLLVGMVFFYIFYDGWFSFFALLITLSVPLFSFLVSLPLFFRNHIDLSSDSPYFTGDSATISINFSTNGASALSGCRLQLVITDVLDSSVRKKDIQISESTAFSFTEGPLHAGTYYIRAEKCRVPDILGLITVPFSSSEELAVKVRPFPVIPAFVPDLTSVRPVRYVPQPNMGFSEITDIRNYRPGDPLRSVHWKLTAKTEDILVKEPQENIMRNIYVILYSTKDRDLTDSSFNEYLWLSSELLKMEVPYILIYVTDHAAIRQKIENEQDVRDVIEQILLIPLAQPGDFSVDIPTDADRIFTVPGKEGL